jgi:hypothetical protein
MKGGNGAAGVPILLFQLRYAACATGAPIEFRDGTLRTIACIRSEMGMLHAKSIMEHMRVLWLRLVVAEKPENRA